MYLIEYFCVHIAKVFIFYSEVYVHVLSISSNLVPRLPRLMLGHANRHWGTYILAHVGVALSMWHVQLYCNLECNGQGRTHGVHIPVLVDHQDGWQEATLKIGPRWPAIKSMPTLGFLASLPLAHYTSNNTSITLIVLLCSWCPWEIQPYWLKFTYRLNHGLWGV